MQNISGANKVICGANPKKIGEFYKELRYNVQSLETMGELVKGNVRSTLEKLKGIKAHLVRGNEGWQNWIVEEAHMLTLHGGIGMTMTELSRRYWNVRLRRLVRKIRNQCYGCRKFRLSAYATPTTGVLPTTRTQGIDPYQVFGMDYADPIRYRKRNGRDGKLDKGHLHRPFAEFATYRIYTEPQA